MRNKFPGLIFRDFDWQENSRSINFRGNGGVISTIIVGFAKYANYCGLIFVDRGIPRNSQKFTRLEILQENTVFVDSPSSSTTVIISDSYSLAFSLGVGGY